MDATTYKNLFKPYMQGDNSTTRRFGGFGLGLLITKNLVEAMLGSIVCQSVLGEGTTMTWTLVLERIGSVYAEHDAAPVEVTASRTDFRVLYVDDNLLNLKLISRALTETGCIVRCSPLISSAHLL